MRNKLTPGRVKLFGVNFVVFRSANFCGRFYFLFLRFHRFFFGKSSLRGFYLQMFSEELLYLQSTDESEMRLYFSGK